MSERKELAQQLRKMAVTTGDLSCLGCGYERGCSVHGCAVLRRAADLLAPKVDITKPIPLEELRAAAAERPVLVVVLCADEDGQLLDVESGDWAMFYADTFVADGIRDTTDTYGRVFVAFWDEPGRGDGTVTGSGHGG